MWVSANLGFNGTSSEVIRSGGSTSTTKGPKTSGFWIMPTLGYNLNENITIGLGIGYESIKTTDDKTVAGGTTNKNISTTNVMGIMPFMRYNMKVNDNFGWYAQLDVTPQFGTIKDESSIGTTTTTTEGKISGFDFGIRPGIGYKLGDHFSINAHYGVLGYNTKKKTWDDKSTSTITKVEEKDNSFGLSLDMSTLGFGLNYHF